MDICSFRLAKATTWLPWNSYYCHHWFLKQALNYVALSGLELTLWTKLALRTPSSPPASPGIKVTCHHSLGPVNSFKGFGIDSLSPSIQNRVLSKESGALGHPLPEQ